MCLTGENFKKCFLIACLMMMGSIVACTSDFYAVQPKIKMDVTPSQTTQLKTFKTSAEYLKEGKRSFDTNHFDEAQSYLSEAVRLDPKNQPAHLLLGVTMVKLGKGSDARSEFDKTVQINGKTADAETAKSWLKRLNNPISVAILPAKESLTISFAPVFATRDQLNWKGAQISRFINNYVPLAEKTYYNTLSKDLSACGFYSIINLYGEEPSKWNVSTSTNQEFLGVRPVSTITNTAKQRGGINISTARNDNAKIAIDSDINYNIKEGVMLIGNYYTIKIHTDVKLYSVKGPILIKDISDELTLEKIPSNELGNYMEKGFEKLFQKMALKIHNALL
jgi:tetratricopeptide (TPR) repeat protein